ncbi:hypothetical protein [Marinomonas aquiplantarum]|uniref:Uncharacterized protein n=1 Tax=Marinomonas aquiplantarum TaxID=491951 RepID=A0A366CVP8_9GAMM|nr:hypothetical protein [Marinomonas aquiplantarum]RBO81893.1 hypothetical protein DFP76_10736 [Marinomonas aquiplantarum]
MGMKYYYQADDVAQLIKKYLNDHPDSEDTVMGITNWWLQKQRINDSMVAVDKALKALERQGEISSITRNDQLYFRLTKR